MYFFFLISATEVPESTLELVQIYFDTATFEIIEKDQRLKFDRGNDGTLDSILHHKWCGGCLLHPEILCVVESQDVGTGHEDLETT